MINLIPKEEKKKIATAFYYKIAILFFLMVDFSILLACVSLIPSYFISKSKVSSINTKLENLKSLPLPSSDKKSLATIKDVNNKLNLIESSEKNKFLVSEKIINAVLLRKIPNIKITQLNFTDNDASGDKINITGIAPSREVLLLFRKTLEDSPAFKSVDLPISNFVKGSNIQFFLTLTPS